MANPQPDIFTKISSELLVALCKIRIPGEARQVLDAIIRKTYGWRKREAEIPTLELMDITGMDRRSVERGRKRLIEMRMITVRTDQQVCGLVYAVQKDYEIWVGWPNGTPKIGGTLGIEVVPPKMSVPSNLVESTPKNVVLVPPKLSVPEDQKAIILRDSIITVKERIDTKDNPIGGKVTKPINPIKEIMAYFYNQYHQAFGTKYVANFGKDGCIFKDILAVLEPAQVKELIDVFFASEDEFIKSTGYTVGAFKSQINKLKAPHLKQDAILKKAGLIHEPKRRENNYR